MPSESWLFRLVCTTETYAASSASAVSAAEPMAKPLPVAAVVLPERVEHVGALADERRLAGHLGVAAGVVGDRAVRVGRERDAQRGEHADGGDADAVEAEQEVLRPPAKVKAR